MHAFRIACSCQVNIDWNNTKKWDGNKTSERRFNKEFVVIFFVIVPAK